MKAIALLSALCATSMLSAPVAARMGGDPNRNNQAKKDDMSAKVDF